MTECTTFYCENQATQTGVFDDGFGRLTNNVTYCDECAEILSDSFTRHSTVEDDQDFTDLVTNIQLGRIYDVLLVLLGQFDKELAAQVAELHKAGQFIGPPPAYDPEPDNG